MGLMGASEVHVTPQHLRVQSAKGHHQNLVTRGNLSSRVQPATTIARYHYRLILLQLLMCTKMEKPACSCVTTVSEGCVPLRIC